MHTTHDKFSVPHPSTPNGWSFYIADGTTISVSIMAKPQKSKQWGGWLALSDLENCWPLARDYRCLSVDGLGHLPLNQLLSRSVRTGLCSVTQVTSIILFHFFRFPPRYFSCSPVFIFVGLDMCQIVIYLSLGTCSKENNILQSILKLFGKYVFQLVSSL